MLIFFLAEGKMNYNQEKINKALHISKSPANMARTSPHVFHAACMQHAVDPSLFSVGSPHYGLPHWSPKCGAAFWIQG